MKCQILFSGEKNSVCHLLKILPSMLRVRFCNMSVFPEKRIWHFMKIVSLRDNLQEMSNPIFWEKNKKNISVCHLQKILPSMLSVRFCNMSVLR